MSIVNNSASGYAGGVPTIRVVSGGYRRRSYSRRRAPARRSSRSYSSYGKARRGGKYGGAETAAVKKIYKYGDPSTANYILGNMQSKVERFKERCLRATTANSALSQAGVGFSQSSGMTLDPNTAFGQGLKRSFDTSQMSAGHGQLSTFDSI